MNFHELSPEKQQKFLKGVSILMTGGVDAVKQWFAKDYQFDLAIEGDVNTILGFCADFQGYIDEHKNGHSKLVLPVVPVAPTQPTQPTQMEMPVGFLNADGTITPEDEFKDMFAQSVIDAPTQPAEPQTRVAVSGAEQVGQRDANTFVDPMPELPATLKGMLQWVLWRLETRNGKDTKVPYKYDGTLASSTDPSTWTDYRTALAHATITQTSGIGFMLANGFAGIDLDGCRDSQTGDITTWAKDILDKLDGVYVEVSPSGTGLHIIVLGKVPGIDKKFMLNPAIGYGKAAVEVYDTARYFTMTGDPFYDEAGDIHDCDLTEVYAVFQQLRKNNPAPTNVKAVAADASDVGSSTKIEQLGSFGTTKYDIFMQGEIESTNPFSINNRLGRLVYTSPSEADMAFATVAAFIYGDNPDAIWNDYTESALVRDKWLARKDYFISHTIAKGIASAAKVKAAEGPTVEQPAADVPRVEYVDSVGSIPPFDPSVINGIYSKFVELATRGTTLCPQYAFVIAKTLVGARMAGHVRFENLDVEPRYYTALIGETGSGKGEAWRRMEQIMVAGAGEGNMAGIKIINSADSGAGIRDVFFEPPMNAPVLMYVDEVRSLGNKAAGTKQPEILDRMIELADSTTVSVVKAARNNKTASSKSTNKARLIVVMCGPDGSEYMGAFAGKTKMGFWDRLYPEYSEPVEPGDLPRINPVHALQLMQEFNALDFSGTMTMAEDAKAFVDELWAGQPVGVKKKVRWKKNVMIDAYMSAFGRGSRVAELEDVQIAARIFTRQLAIRREHFTDEVPDRTGYYLGLIKKITESMRRQLNAGVDVFFVALSRRDYEKRTNASRDNEEHYFEKAWALHSKHHLQPVNIQKRNGQTYAKYIPIPDEPEE